MDKFTALLDVYSITISVFIIAVYAEAGLLEIVKKGMENWTDKSKGTVSMAAALILSALFVGGIYCGLPHPGNFALIPIWYTLFVVCQYFADFNGGVKSVFKWATTTREPKEKTEKPKRQKVKYAKFPVDDNGNPVV